MVDGLAAGRWPLAHAPHRSGRLTGRQAACLTAGPRAGYDSPRPAPAKGMQLLVAVINQEDRIDEVLAGFVELGITGATLLESRGMGRVLSRELPLFAGLRSLGEFSRASNHTILCVAEEAKVDAALALLQEVCGDLGGPGRGIAFTVPVARVVGLSPELER